MFFRHFTDGWWFWMLCVIALLTRGYLYGWDWIAWCLLALFTITGIARIVTWRRKKLEARLPADFLDSGALDLQSMTGYLLG